MWLCVVCWIVGICVVCVLLVWDVLCAVVRCDEAWWGEVCWCVCGLCIGGIGVCIAYSGTCDWFVD